MIYDDTHDNHLSSTYDYYIKICSESLIILKSSCEILKKERILLILTSPRHDFLFQEFFALEKYWVSLSSHPTLTSLLLFVWLLLPSVGRLNFLFLPFHTSKRWNLRNGWRDECWILLLSSTSVSPDMTIRNSIFPSKTGSSSPHIRWQFFRHKKFFLKSSSVKQSSLMIISSSISQEIISDNQITRRRFREKNDWWWNTSKTYTSGQEKRRKSLCSLIREDG